jgi:tetratricopeptide (TPR) repeat protein
MTGVGLRGLACVMLWAACSVVLAQDSELERIRDLIRQGQFDQALEQVEAHLASSPDDPQGRFLKGVVLAEENRLADAIEVFSQLTKDFPELPEPHNNLAVLYAASGEYAKARDSLLVAINTHPSYATAHENLGDIYAKMAGVAYDRALQIDTSNQTAKAKLALIGDMFPVPGGPASVVAAVAPPRLPASRTAATAGAADAQTRADLVATVREWARAWATQDVDRYLGFYAPGFRPESGQARSAWAAGRRSRLQAPKFIEVAVSDVSVQISGSGRAAVTFTQVYRSDRYQDQARKRVEMTLNEENWKIVRERSL